MLFTCTILQYHHNIFLTAIPVVGTEQSAQRPNVLPLRHTISTDIMIQESQEVPSCESHYSGTQIIVRFQSVHAVHLVSCSKICIDSS